MTEWTHDEWLAEARRRFGPDMANWKFRCPSCGNVASGAEFKALALLPKTMYQDCIGRHKTGIGCDYAAYGLIQSDDTVKMSNGDIVHVFPFAEVQ